MLIRQILSEKLKQTDRETNRFSLYDEDKIELELLAVSDFRAFYAIL